MKNLKLTFATLLFTAFSAIYAQDRPQMPTEQRQEIVNLMQENKERLKLTPEQEPTFDEISTRYFKQFRETKGSDIRVTEKFRKVKEMQEQKDAEMKKLLSEEQYATYLTIQQERRNKQQQKQ